MYIDKAKGLNQGNKVLCPSDRGSAPFIGTVIKVGEEVYKTKQGVEYIWIHVRGPLHNSVWPSNRLNIS